MNDSPDWFHGLIVSLKWMAAFALSLWTSADTDIKILAALAIADVIVNLFNPKVSLLLLCRRLAITFLLVGTVHFVYSLAKAQSGLNLGFDISGLVSTFYCIGETMAILRGCDAVGVRLPPVLLDWIGKAEGLTGKDRNEIVALKLKQDQEGTALDLKISQRKDDDDSPIVKP